MSADDQKETGRVLESMLDFVGSTITECEDRTVTPVKYMMDMMPASNASPYDYDVVFTYDAKIMEKCGCAIPSATVQCCWCYSLQQRPACCTC